MPDFLRALLLKAEISSLGSGDVACELPVFGFRTKFQDRSARRTVDGLPAAATWSTLTRWRGLEGAFASPALKSAIRLAVRAGGRPPSLQERQGRHIRRVVQAVGDLRDGQPARYQRPSHPDGRLCFRRSPTQRDRRAAHRPANDRTLHSYTERSPSPRSPSISVAPRQAAAKRTMSYISRAGRVDALRRLDDGVEDRQGQPVSGNRALGDGFAASARPAIGQRHHQTARHDGGVGPRGVFRAWTAVGIPNAGCQSWNSAARGNRAIAPSVASAGVELL